MYLRRGEKKRKRESVQKVKRRITILRSEKEIPEKKIVPRILGSRKKKKRLLKKKKKNVKGEEQEKKGSTDPCSKKTTKKERRTGRPRGKWKKKKLEKI